MERNDADLWILQKTFEKNLDRVRFVSPNGVADGLRGKGG
jgi:hypothetical protein